MGQSFNLWAIKFFTKNLFSPSVFKPSRIVADVSHIDFALLKQGGIKALAFDKDNTLTAPYELEIHPRIRKAFQEARAEFGSNIVIVSNSAGSPDDKNYLQAQKIENEMKINVLRHPSKKPDGGKELLAYFNHFRAKEIAVIGDRLLTDVAFANLIGAHSILCREVLTTTGDNKLAAFVRSLEHFIIDRFYKYRLKPPST